jgi:hypothetical protein
VAPASTLGPVASSQGPGHTPLGSPSARASAYATGTVQGITAPGSTPPQSAATWVTAVGGSGPPGGAARPVSSPGATVETTLGLGGTAALLAAAVAWRTLRPRRRPHGSGAAVPVGAAAVAAPALPESPLFLAWRRELDDLADLAALTVPPDEQAAARLRRSTFSSDAIVRRLIRAVEEQPDDA